MTPRWGFTVWLRIVLVYLFVGVVVFLILRSKANDPLMVVRSVASAWQARLARSRKLWPIGRDAAGEVAGAGARGDVSTALNEGAPISPRSPKHTRGLAVAAEVERWDGAGGPAA